MILKEEASQQTLNLRSLHIFGRNAIKSDTILDSKYASQLHASIRWTGHIWELINHSRNGTFINGKQISVNERIVLAVGQKIRFAPASMQSWLVENLAPPAPILLPLNSDAPVVELRAPHFFPDERKPQVSIHRSIDGIWLRHTVNDSGILQDGDIVDLSPNRWRFFSGKWIEATLDVGEHQIGRKSKVNFSFNVSQNEEHVVLTISINDKQADLGERIHHYSLLTLARQRVSDALRGLDVSAQGWLSIEQLSAMLGVELGHLNMQLFRARIQISRHFPGWNELQNVLERRRGEVRFGAIPFEIIRGSQLEVRFDPFLPLPETAQNHL